MTLLSQMPKQLKSNFEWDIITRIKEMRLQKHLSQEDIAATLNVTRGFIGQIETPASPSKYSLDQLNSLARLFKCSPKDFMPEKSIKEKGDEYD